MLTLVLTVLETAAQFEHVPVSQVLRVETWQPKPARCLGEIDEEQLIDAIHALLVERSRAIRFDPSSMLGLSGCIGTKDTEFVSKCVSKTD